MLVSLLFSGWHAGVGAESGNNRSKQRAEQKDVCDVVFHLYRCIVLKQKNRLESDLKNLILLIKN